MLERKVDLRQAVTEVRGVVAVGPLKTPESRRTVTLPGFLVEALAEHLSKAASGEGLVFPAPDGGPLRRTNWRRRFWLPAVGASGIDPPVPRFHDLRHHGAAVVIAAGAHPRAIQARLGHASITTTLNVYGGLFPSLDEELADRLDENRPSVVARLWHDGPGTRAAGAGNALTCISYGGR